jgi:hypothetical protein
MTDPLSVAAHPCTCGHELGVHPPRMVSACARLGCHCPNFVQDYTLTLASEDELMSTNEIATLFGVKPGTVHAWRTRRIFPPPDFVLSGTPIWRRERVEYFGRATDRVMF